MLINRLNGGSFVSWLWIIDISSILNDSFFNFWLNLFLPNLLRVYLFLFPQIISYYLNNFWVEKHKLKFLEVVIYLDIEQDALLFLEVILNVFLLPVLNDFWGKNLSLNRIIQVKALIGLCLIDWTQLFFWLGFRPADKFITIGFIHDSHYLFEDIELFPLGSEFGDISVLNDDWTYLWLIIGLEADVVVFLFEMFGPVFRIDDFGIPSKLNVLVIFNVVSQLFWS